MLSTVAEHPITEPFSRPAKLKLWSHRNSVGFVSKESKVARSQDNSDAEVYGRFVSVWPFWSVCWKCSESMPGYVPRSAIVLWICKDSHAQLKHQGILPGFRRCSPPEPELFHQASKGQTRIRSTLFWSALKCLRISYTFSWQHFGKLQVSEKKYAIR